MSQYFFANFTFNERKLKMNILVNNYAELSNLNLETLRILGFSLSKKDSLSVKVTTANSRINIINIANIDTNEHGEIKLSNLKLKMNEEFEIDFSTATVTENIDINDEKLRVDCWPEPDASETKCLNRKCRW